MQPGDQSVNDPVGDRANECPSDPAVDAAVRRVVGRAALQRLRGLVDADAAQEAANARWARRLSYALLALAVVGVIVLTIR